MRKLGWSLIVIGKNLETEKFWQGVKTEERPVGSACLDGIGLLLAPALVSSRPRFLMQALRRGLTVIATEACGLPPDDRLHLVDPYDENALAQKIEKTISSLPLAEPASTY